MNVVYVTGNEHKAKHFSEMVGMYIENVAVDIDEIQSLSLREIIEYKAKQAYDKVKKPVIVEDTKLIFNALGSLPGPLIKWFLDELKVEGLCKLLDGYDDRTAVAGAAIAYYDGVNLEIFEKELIGIIADKPKGKSGFGWNVIFIPNGSTQTLGEMNDVEFKKYYAKIKPFWEISKFLKNLT
jgi:non-canonical purine NTP pyrophosphatase (RdgB/HAM1 family)